MKYNCVECECGREIGYRKKDVVYRKLKRNGRLRLQVDYVNCPTCMSRVVVGIKNFKSN